MTLRQTASEISNDVDEFLRGYGIDPVMLRARILTVGLVVVAASVVTIEPAAANEGIDCDNDLETLLRNIMGFGAGIGLVSGLTMATVFSVAASATSKAEKRKKHKERVQQAIIWGAIATILPGLGGVFAELSPSQTCLD